jgi:ribosomal protein S27AE
MGPPATAAAHQTDPNLCRVGVTTKETEVAIQEALCERCGETFNPNDERDTIERDGVTLWLHYATEAGDECGGYGEVVGEWRPSFSTFVPATPCPRCDQASVVDEHGACVHCGADRFGGVPRYPSIVVPMIGEDGNAFAVIGRVQRALRSAGLDDQTVAAFRQEATQGSYDALLATVMRWVEVA